MGRGKMSRMIALVLTAIALLLPIVGMPTVGADGDEGTRGPTPHYTEVTVQLEYSNGTGAAGLSVYLQNHYAQSHDRLTGTTDGSGETTFIVQMKTQGPCKLWAHDGTEAFWWYQDLMVEPDGRHVVPGTVGPPLPWDRTIEGVVRNTTNGLAMAGVEVSYFGYDAKGRLVSDVLTTGASGEYSFMVPNSSSEFHLSAQIAGSEEYNGEFQVVPGKMAYERDIWLTPFNVPQRTVSVKCFNETTGEVMEMDYINLYGHSSVRGHATVSASAFTPDPVTGYIDLMTDPGDYEVRLVSIDDPVLNVSFELYNYVHVDGSDVVLDSQMPVPEQWRCVRVNIQDDDGPVFYGYAEYYLSDLSDMRFSVRGSANADIDGNAWIYIPAWTEVTLGLWYFSLESQEVVVPAGPPEMVSYVNVTLEDSAVHTPDMGQLSLLVRDEVTGHPASGTYVSASAYDYGTGAWLSFYGTTASDGFLNKSVNAGTYPKVHLSSGLGTGILADLVVPKDGTANAVGTIQRRGFPQDPVPVQFSIVTEGGSPVPEVPITFYSETAGNYELMSDKEGTVRAMLPPADYSTYFYDDYDSLRTPRSYWIKPLTMITVTSPGGDLPDIVVFPNAPLQAIQGYVKDAVTGEVIVQQTVSSYSYHPLPETPTRQMPYIMGYWEEIYGQDEPEVGLFWDSYGGSDSSGRYRTWGIDHVEVRVDREGYYPLERTFDLSSRAVTEEDLLLEPLPESNTFVNGTLMDQDHLPIEGSVAILDVPHGHFEIDAIMVDGTGAFSLRCYPGSLRVLFGNETLWDYIDVEVPEGGIDDLELVLAPFTWINGTVTDHEGAPVPDLEVSRRTLGSPTNGSVDTTFTDEGGNFSFPVGRGTYRITISGTDANMAYDSGELTTDGWERIRLDIVLEERTAGDLFGSILAQGGPFPLGIPNATVALSGEDGPGPWTINTDEDGKYLFAEVPFGDNYTLEVTPPALYLGVPGIRSGYLPNTIGNISVSAMDNEMSLYLNYITVAGAETVDIEDWGPKGQDVALNSPIWMEFSESMNRSSVLSSISIVPGLSGQDLTWSMDDRKLAITCDGLSPETNYTVTMLSTVLSAAGMGLTDPRDLVWTFRTGTEATSWYLDYSYVEVFSDRSWTVTATGGPGQDVYFVIDDVGSFRLEETDPGQYAVKITGELFEWNTRYSYHYSNTDGGPDSWPQYSGSAYTPEEGKPFIPDDGEEVIFEPNFLGCLGFCGICILVIVLIIAAVLIVSKLK